MIDFSNATIEELEVVAYEEEYAGVIDKQLAISQLNHRQIDMYDYIGIEG